MTEPPRAPADGAWILLPPDDVPDEWRARGRSVVMIQVLPEELDDMLTGQAAPMALDERDQEIADLIIAGASISQVAKAVGLSPRGVQHRLQRLRERFDAASTTELAAYLARHGFGTKRQ